MEKQINWIILLVNLRSRLLIWGPGPAHKKTWHLKKKLFQIYKCNQLKTFLAHCYYSKRIQKKNLCEKINLIKEYVQHIS